MLLFSFAERFGLNGFSGEHLWIGHLGHFFVVFCFSGALLAFVSYFAAEFSQREVNKKSWNRIARVAFIAQGIAIVGVFAMLFIMILTNKFEYYYAWRHSSTALPLKYIVASFWEGQEGSFLLWMFWISVLGIIGIRTMKEYENPVMGVVSLTQVFLASMILGVYILEKKIGNSPFTLLRDQMNSAPIFQRSNYLSFIQDGNGLNPLLQNYWMTIHPPILFCGFASVTFPFAFAIASLLRRDWNGWIKKVFPWALFSVVVLGTGILMGGAWAYESLSFGGFWAWDPVENMSFVPWLLVVAGLHMLLVFRYTKHSAISTYFFFIFAFLLVLYSTYLTRSGRLGDTSVHSFTDDGLEPQLLAYMAFFFVAGITLLLIRVFDRSMPSNKTEEHLWSREFWMFIGTLVLLLSAIQMTFTTSIPVWNLLFHDKWHLLHDKIAPPEDVVKHYNDIQIWLGMLVCFLTALIQYFAYKTGKIPSIAKWAFYMFLVSVVLACGIAYAVEVPFTEQHVIDLTKISSALFFKFNFLSRLFLLLIASVYTVTANLWYIVYVLKGKFNLWGGSIAHFGFGIFVVGALISQGKKEVISLNGQQGQAFVNFGDQFKENERRENILMLRDSTLKMGQYLVTYTGIVQRDSLTKKRYPNDLYAVNYVMKDAKGNEKESFTLYPEAGINPKMGMVANPSTKHYLTKDVFTHIASLPNNESLKDTLYTAEVSLKDTFVTHVALLRIDTLQLNPELPAGYSKAGKLLVGVNAEAITEDNKIYPVQPVYVVDMDNNNMVSSIPAEVKELGLTVNVTGINPTTKKISLAIREKEKPSDFIIMKAIVFPYINLVWLGGIITFFGAFLSMLRRIKEGRRNATEEA